MGDDSFAAGPIPLTQMAANLDGRLPRAHSWFAHCSVFSEMSAATTSRLSASPLLIARRESLARRFVRFIKNPFYTVQCQSSPQLPECPGAADGQYISAWWPCCQHGVSRQRQICLTITYRTVIVGGDRRCPALWAGRATQQNSAVPTVSPPPAPPATPRRPFRRRRTW